MHAPGRENSGGGGRRLCYREQQCRCEPACVVHTHSMAPLAPSNLSIAPCGVEFTVREMLLNDAGGPFGARFLHTGQTSCLRSGMTPRRMSANVGAPAAAQNAAGEGVQQ